MTIRKIRIGIGIRITAGGGGGAVAGAEAAGPRGCSGRAGIRIGIGRRASGQAGRGRRSRDSGCRTSGPTGGARRTLRIGPCTAGCRIGIGMAIGIGMRSLSRAARAPVQLAELAARADPSGPVGRRTTSDNPDYDKHGRGSRRPSARPSRAPLAGRPPYRRATVKRKTRPGVHKVRRTAVQYGRRARTSRAPSYKEGDTMREITVRWEATCARCAGDIAIGARAKYERGCGTFCLGCGPDDDELRQLRRAALDSKAARREEWAGARMRRANTHQSRCDALMGRDRSADGRADWALVSQPGHIPQRAQALRAQERAWEEQRAASRHAAIAASLRATPALVKGDTARRRAAANEAARVRVLEWASVGMAVIGNPYPSPMPIVRLNRQTVTLEGSYGPIKVAYTDIERAKGGAS